MYQRWLRRAVTAAGIAALMLLLAPAAYGQAVGGPTEGTYGGEGGDTVADVDRGATDPAQGGSTADPQKVRSGALPFTGIDLLLLSLGAVALAGAGAGLARVVARSAPSTPS